MSKRIQLSVPKPCHQNWENMSAIEQGRFCSSCQKQVVDFSSMTDREVATFFRKKSTGSVCGRFMQDQLERDIDIPKKRIPWLKYFFQFLIPAFLISCRENIVGKVKVTETEATVRLENRATLGVVIADIDLDVDTISTHSSLPDTTAIITDDDTYSIKGLVAIDSDKSMVTEYPGIVKGAVVDEYDNPVSYANVKGNFFPPLVTNDSGLFTFQVKPGQDICSLKMEVSSIGYKSKIINSLDSSVALLTIRLEKDFKNISPVTVAADVYTKGQVSVMVCKKDELLSENNSVAEPSPVLLLFPNPVRPGALLNVRYNDAMSAMYSIQLFSISGQLMLSRQMVLEKRSEVFRLQLPVVAAGSYILRMVNKESGRTFSEKFIVQ